MHYLFGGNSFQFLNPISNELTMLLFKSHIVYSTVNLIRKSRTSRFIYRMRKRIGILGFESEFIGNTELNMSKYVLLGRQNEMTSVLKGRYVGCTVQYQEDGSVAGQMCQVSYWASSRIKNCVDIINHSASSPVPSLLIE